MEQVLQGIHIFSERTDLTVKSICRELKRKQEELEGLERAYATFAPNQLPAAIDMVQKEYKPTDVIVYPSVVSRFGNIQLSSDYIVSSYSKSRKAPVLLCVAGESQGTQAMILHWGLAGRCICKISFIKGEQENVFTCYGLDALTEQLPHIVPHSSVLFSSLETQLPMDVLSALSQELGIFLGEAPIENFLSHCMLNKEIPLGKVYKYKN